MPNRLEPINLVDFSGGLNLRENQFQLADNESPEMHNIVIDPLGGIYSRRGWQRWNANNVVPEGEPWDPRRAYLQQLSDGTDLIYVAASGMIYWAGAGGNFSDLGVVCGAVPHLADFNSWSDDLYIACGRTHQMAKRHLTNPVSLLAPAGASTWNDDYTAPGASGTVAPQAEVIEVHSGYLFAANITEDGVTFPNRVRWSHPSSPTDWAQADYFDIEVGGSQITGLMSYEDHLLIFKNDGMWALYGYELESWQLVQKSSTIGALSPQAITRNEQMVFFGSAADRGAIYAYSGERSEEISEQLRYAFENLISPELVWIGWLDRKLWVTLPWTYEGPTSDNSAVFVFDPSVGPRGAWTYYRSTEGSLGPLVGGSNVDSSSHPMGVLRATDNACVVYLNAREEASDLISHVAVLGCTGVTGTEPFTGDSDGFLVTGSDEEIIASGMPGEAPFDTRYRTPWVHASWPTRKKSWRRPDFVCRDTGVNHALRVRSYRDYEESQPKRQYTLEVFAGDAVARWGHFDWDDGTLWGQGNKTGGMIRRGSSFGLAKALQLVVEGATPGARWGVDAIILKIVMRRFR